MGVSAEKTMFIQMLGQRAVLVCSAGTFDAHTFEWMAGTFTIGRGADCTLCLGDDANVSRLHAKIQAEGDAWFVVDNDSRNGTLMNGKPVRSSPLRDGDVLRISTCELQFSFSSTAQGEAPVPGAVTKTTVQRERQSTTSKPVARAPDGLVVINPASDDTLTRSTAADRQHKPAKALWPPQQQTAPSSRLINPS